MAGLIFALTVAGMLALHAAMFVALVVVGVRLANGSPVLPHRNDWWRRLASSFEILRSAVGRARRWDGGRF